MDGRKAIGFIFIQGFADWEYGLLSASAAEWFGANVLALTPGGEEMRSTAGFLLSGDRSLDPAENADLDALAVIGSENWTKDGAPDVAPLLTGVMNRGGLVGGICAGTLALARSGLFEGRRHTSNGRDWLRERAPSYAGAEHYQDVPHAVADAGVVSAPGSAPGTFAIAFLENLYPERREEIASMRAIFSAEHRGDAAA